MKLLQLLLKGNPLKSITLTGVLTLLGGYLLAHFDPTMLTPTGATVYAVVAGALGVLLHHGGTSAGNTP